MRTFISALFYLLVSSFLTAQDFTPPTVSVTSHANGAIVNSRTITLSGVASDAGRGDSGISYVYARGTLPNTSSTGAGTVNWATQLILYPGTNSIDVYAYDNSPQRNSRLINIVIYFQPLDTLGPLTQATSHQNGQIVNTKTITLSGTSTDAGRGNNGISSVYVRGYIPNSNAAGVATVNWTQQVTLNPGVNNIEIGASDNSDVQTYLSQTLTINFQPTDPLPPTIAIASHANGQIVGTSTIVLSGTATDSGRGNNGISSVYLRGYLQNATTTGAQTVNWSKEIQLQPGANSITVYASDDSDVKNEGRVDLTVNFQPSDTLAPTLNVTSHTTGQTVFTSTITLQGTATDAGRGDRGISEIYLRGKIPNANTTGSGLVNWTRTVELQPGRNYLYLSAYDGNEFPNVVNQTMIINFQPQDTLGPAILLTSHTDGQILSTKTVTLSGTVTDAGRGDQGISEFFLQGKLPGVTAVGAAVVPWSKTLELQQGKNYITIFAYDNAPFPNQSSLNLVLDVVPEDILAPTLVITSHTDQQVVGTNRILVTGTATDAGRGGHGITAVVLNSVRADNDTATGSSVATWSRWITLNPGRNTLYATATDGSLFPQSAYQQIVIFFDEGDQLPPAISIDSHRNNQVVTTPTILLSGTVSDSGLGANGVAFVRVNGNPAAGGVATGAASANWSRNVTLVPGLNILSVVAEDTRGNSEAKAISLLYNPSDLLAPRVEINSHQNGQTVNTSTIILSGLATDNELGGSGISSVKINGVLIPGASSVGNTNTNWSSNVTLVPGVNLISVVAADSFQNNGAASVSIIYNPVDTIPPALLITSHTKNQVILQNQITLAGTATDLNLGNSGITSVQVNGNPAAGGSAAGGATAQWTRPLTLELGDNVISVVASDSAGNSTAQTITLHHNPSDNVPPEIEVLSHRNDQIVGTSLIILRGTASDAGLGGNGVAGVTVDGDQVAGATAIGDGQAPWSLPVQLSQGANVISITAADTQNNLGAKSITLHYDPGFSATTADFCWATNEGGRQMENAYGVALDPQGNSFVVGSFLGTATFGSTTLISAGGLDIFLAKLNPQGEVLWAIRAGGPNDDAGFDVAVDTSGNAFITGYYTQNASFGQTSPGETNVAPVAGYNLFVAKYDSAGLLSRVRTPLAADRIYGSGIAVDPGGNVVVVGSYYQGSATSDLFVARFDPGGVLLWVEAAGGPENDQGTKVATDSEGKIFITGSFTDSAWFGEEILYGNESIEMFVAKYDANGFLEWAQAAVSDEALGTDIAVDAAGNCVVTGYFEFAATFGTETLYSDGYFDFFLTKFDPDGEVIWATNSETNDAIAASGIALGAEGNIYVTGSFVGDVTLGRTTLSNDYIFDLFVAAYDETGNPLFFRGAGTEGELTSSAIAVDPGGSLIVAGQLTGRAVVGADDLLSTGDSDVFVAKLSISENGGVKAGFTSYHRRQDGAFHLEFNLDACSTWRLQASPDLKEWRTLQTYEAASSFQIFIDQEAKNLSRRFYRLMAP